MTFPMIRRALVGCLTGALLFQTGCAGGTKVLDREDLVHPEPAREYTVTLKDGRTLTFIALHLEGDNLAGTQRITREVTEGTGETARTNVTNRYLETRVPWSEVDQVQADLEGGKDQTIFIAAGAILAGVGVFLLATSGDSNPPAGDGGGGKTPP